MHTLSDYNTIQSYSTSENREIVKINIRALFIQAFIFNRKSVRHNLCEWL